MVLVVLGSIAVVQLKNQSLQPGIRSPWQFQDLVELISYTTLFALGIEALFRIKRNKPYLLILLGCMATLAYCDDLHHKIFGHVVFALGAESMITRVELYGNGRFVSKNMLDSESRRSTGCYEINGGMVQLWKHRPTEPPENFSLLQQADKLRCKGMDFHLGHEQLDKLD